MSGSVIRGNGGTAHDDPNFERIPGINSMLNEEGLNTPTTEAGQPVYKKMEGSKLPVSKHLGKVWKSRIDATRTGRRKWEESWDAAVEAYSADQQGHRVDGRSGTSSNKRTARRKNEDYSHTENVIFSAIKALIPAVYARNPVPEFTAPDIGNEESVKWVQCLEKVCITLGSMRNAPGINIKYKVKQAIVSAKLMNLGWVETGYTLREDSSGQALADLQKLSLEYEKAESTKDIIAIEGQLQALEEKVNTLAPSGPYTRFYSSKDVFVDADSMEPDFADARWMAVADYLPTSYLNAVYGQRQEDGTYKSIYEPTSVLLAKGTDQGADNADNMKLFDTSGEMHSYGYSDQQSYRSAQRTKCWRIYDKTTRRIYLYADNKWDWPIWVEDDMLELPNFFPFEPLLFNVSPMGPYAHSEVAYVFDQQDAINEINDAERRARFDLVYRILYDMNAGSRETIERVLKGATPVAEAIKVPDGKTIDQMFYTPKPPMLNAPQLFDVNRQRQVVDGILGVTPSLRASEYKTNTTNKAIEQYNSTTSSRLDEQIDEIEEFVGRIYFNVAFLCARFMDQSDVAALIGQDYAANWRQVNDPKQLVRMFTMRVVGGSTTKPTSQFKQQVAIQIAQALGQFANAAPAAITTIVLKLFEQAYDEVGISQEDWDKLNAEVAAKLGIEAASAQPQPSQPTDNAGAGGGVPNNAGGGIERVIQQIDSLPPEAKAALGNAMAKGVPLVQAVQQIMQLVQQAGPSPQQ